MKLELEVNGELEHTLERLAALSEKQDGSDASVEDVAKQLLRESGAERYREILLTGL